MGQVIAKPTGDGVYVHASVSGRVKAIEPRPHPWGGKWDAVVIENDFKNTPYPDLPLPMDWERMNREEALQRICQAGITSLGGGASPTHLRIRQAVGKTEVLIVNAAECEPYLTADHRLLLEKGDQILQAVQMLSRLVRAEKAILVVAGDKLNAVEFLERACAGKARGGAGHHPDPLPLRHGKAAHPRRHRPRGVSRSVCPGCGLRGLQRSHRVRHPPRPAHR